MQLSKYQIEAFDKDGFLIIPNYFIDEEIKAFQDTLKEVIRANLDKNGLKVDEGMELDDGLLLLEELDHFYVADIYDTVAKTLEFMRLITKKDTSSIINQLMKRKITAPLYTYTCRCRIDPPQDNRRTYGWHQEVFYSIPNSNFLQTWAPLVHNASKENGTIEVCIGSHAKGIAPQTWNEIEGRALQIIVDEEVANSYEQKVIEIDVGSLLIFDYRLFHRSGNNTSKKVRYSLVGMYHDATNPKFHSADIILKNKKIDSKDYFDQYFNK